MLFQHRLSTHEGHGDDAGPGPALHVLAEVPKVIVFSQYWIHMQLIAQQLERSGIMFVTLKGGECAPHASPC